MKVNEKGAKGKQAVVDMYATYVGVSKTVVAIVGPSGAQVSEGFRP